MRDVFDVGISAKLKIAEDDHNYYSWLKRAGTFYGISSNGYWYLDGNPTKNAPTDTVQNRNVDPYWIMESDAYIDIFVDADLGILRMKPITQIDDHDISELKIVNINKCPTNPNAIHGWIPYFAFNDLYGCKQQVRIAQIDESLYGKQIQYFF